ncbi:cyclic 2,3-diphosphoglycerate synthase [Nitrospina gracilis]|uniref:cyclic 2,3-diphosphoglycerate synthase n=1 Tax=Nitrospina gracilis TaxID=35801 RepID=UPI001F228BE4|nr:cyclic 2,3-diphosphoglycerate synthase [Nitrospina gracilis]MCF8721130.1 putative GTPase [Nitrospina gracilis Nb-211]
MADAKTRVIIMGAAGRDFHNFNVFFRANPEYEVVAFTATQIPGIEDKRYPPGLSGKLYPDGIPIFPEEKLTCLIREHGVHRVVFAYSDVRHEYVMHRASDAMAAGADFWLMGPDSTMLPSSRKVISVCAVRTGCGKSQTSRKIVRLLKEKGKRVAAVRHAMPYGDLEKQKVQRFASLDDLKKHNCTIEEMEEYEPYIDLGAAIYAGVDYEAILREAEKEADIILWDGGNNDFPFYRPDLEIVVADPHRAGHELQYHPGEVNLKRADVVIINKLDSAEAEAVRKLRDTIAAHNPKAEVIDADSLITLEGDASIEGRRVLVVEDGPTLTHGEMRYGAGTLAAQRQGARELVDPRPWAQGTIRDTFDRYPGIGALLPAMGYGPQQIQDLERTIHAVECDLVVIGTPIDLSRIVRIDKPTVRVRYELAERGTPNLNTVLDGFLKTQGL